MLKKEAERYELSKRKYIRGRFKELEEYRDEVWHCNRCNMCKEVFGWYMRSNEFSDLCPPFAYHKWETFAAQGRMHIARAIIDKEFDWEDSDRLMEIIFSCETCGGCSINALRIMEENPLEVFRALRARAVEKGIVPPEHKKFYDSTNKYGNPLGVAKKEERLKWTEGLGFKVKVMPQEKAPVLMFTGCQYALEPKLRDIMKSIAQVLKAGGVDFGILGANELCCSGIQLLMGERGMFEKNARENIKTFNSLGIKTLLTPCAHCYNTFVNEYVEMGDMNFEVLHTVQLFDRLIDQGKIKLNGVSREAVTWHDPCDLGRKCGVYDVPRKMLSGIKGIELREMDRFKDQTWCCGGGGGLLEAYPEQAAWAAQERIREAKATTGADSLVTACPWCEFSFKNAIEAMGAKIKLNNIAEVLQRASK